MSRTRGSLSAFSRDALPIVIPPLSALFGIILLLASEVLFSRSDAIAYAQELSTTQRHFVESEEPPLGTMRLELAFESSEPDRWQGTFALATGRFADPLPIPFSADIPGSYWIEQGSFRFWQRSPKRHSEFHLTVDAPLGTTLRMILTGERQQQKQLPPIEHTMALADLHRLQSVVSVALDDRGSTLKIRRIEGDELPVRVRSESMVFAPNQPLHLDLYPRFLAIPHEKGLKLRVGMCRIESCSPGVESHTIDDRLASIELDVPENFQHNPTHQIPAALTLPAQEGKYLLIAELLGRQEGGLIAYAKRRPVLTVQQVPLLIIDPIPQARSTISKREDLYHELIETVDDSSLDGRKYRKIQSLLKIGNLGVLSARSPSTGQTNRSATTEENPSQPLATSPAPGRSIFPTLSALRSSERTEKNDTSESPNGIKIHSHVPPVSIRDRTAEEPEKIVQLPPTSLAAGSSAHEEFEFGIVEIGKPHVLEIDFPSDQEQILDVTISTPDGSLLLESGIEHIPLPETGTPSPRILTHRVLFWPCESTIRIALRNRHEELPAGFGKLKLFRIAERFPKPPSPPKRNDAQRRFMLMFDKMDGLLKQFGGSPFRDSLSDCYDNAHRLLEYMQIVGYDGLMLPIVEAGATSYPSRHLESSPLLRSIHRKHPTEEHAVETSGESHFPYSNILPSLPQRSPSTKQASVFHEGPSPVPNRYDPGEVVFRLFDREGLVLIPSIDFSAPIPSLEERLRREPALLSEIRWIGPDGKSLTMHQGTREGRAPYYNLLHPLVQHAMREVIAEAVSKYGHHRSFGGLAIQLGPDGFAQLPDDSWGMDDRTIAAFQFDTGIAFPAELQGTQGVERHAKRWEYIRHECREAWILWRASKVADFYRLVREDLRSMTPSNTLYLAGGRMFEAPSIEQRCSPPLPRGLSASGLIRLFGFDLSQLAVDPGIVFLKPLRDGTGEKLSRHAPYLELEHSDMNSMFAEYTATPTVAFTHRLNTGSLRGLTCASEENSRKRFIRQLAVADVIDFMDGGDAVPLGQEEALREFMMAYRSLPKEAFTTFIPPQTGKTNEGRPAETGERSIQPLYVRYLKTSDAGWFYLVNDAPFPIQATLYFRNGTSNSGPENESNVSSATRTAPLFLDPSGLRTLPECLPAPQGFALNVFLKPYDLLVLQGKEPDRELYDVRTAVPSEILAPKGPIQQRIEELNTRIGIACQGIAYPVLENPGFESGDPSADSSPATKNIPGWTLWNKTGETSNLHAEYDTVVRAAGISSLKIQSRAAAASPRHLHQPESPQAPFSGGTLLSHRFPAPATGRIFVTARIALPSDTVSVPLGLTLYGKYRDESRPPFIHSVELESLIASQRKGAAAADGIRWYRVGVPFDRLPSDTLESLQLGIDVTGPVTAWVDEMTLYQVVLTPQERNDLIKLLYLAETHFAEGRFSQILTTFDRYWPRFLMQHVPNPAPEPPAFAPAAVGANYAANRSTPVSEKERREETVPKKNVGPLLKMKPDEKTSDKRVGNETNEETPGFFGRIRTWFGGSK